MSSSLKTPLCDLLRITYPILQAGMAGGMTTPQLVASVSNAGGLGILAATRLTPEETRAMIQETKSLTSRPFGVNFLIAPPEPSNQDAQEMQRILDTIRDELRLPRRAADISLPRPALSEQLGIALEEKVPLISFGLGDPTKFVPEAHGAGSKVMGMVTSVDEAARISTGGVDIVAVQGSEAGGHRSTFELGPNGEVPLVGTMALVPAVVDSIDLPVVAAGGIMDGRGVAAALALGASGAMLGTRFLVSAESAAFQGYKDKLLSSKETDTVMTSGFTGRPARAIRNTMTEIFSKDDFVPLAWPRQAIAADDIYKAAMQANKPDYYHLLAGQGLRMINGRPVEPASEIVVSLVKEAKAAIGRLVLS